MNTPFTSWISRVSFSLLGLMLLTSCELQKAAPPQSAKGDSKSKGAKVISKDEIPHTDPYSAPLIASSNPEKGAPFDIRLVNGETFSLGEQRGKVVIMNIWATWCAPCLRETPDLVELYTNYKDQGVEILGVSIDEQGRSVVMPFIEKFDVNYPIYIDTDGSMMAKYGPTMGIPTTYILDKEGRIRYYAVGAVTQQELIPRLKHLLSEDIL